MLVLVNTNRMSPPIGPLGLDYVAGSAAQAGIDVELLDLCRADDSDKAMESCFSRCGVELIGISFRNSDDCMWPSGDWFIGELKRTVGRIRELNDAPIVVGGVGFSVFAKPIIECTGVDFGIRGDGEQAVVELVRQLRGGRDFAKVPGLLWQSDDGIAANPPSWPQRLCVPTGRDFVDNPWYFERGGQCGIETKRGCSLNCIYCADAIAKGSVSRLREPSEVADEVEFLLAQGVDVLHTCDSEFNIPGEHALAVCDELIRRGLGGKARWYTYMTPQPFNAEMASKLARAGCVGINFTGDSACSLMLRTYCKGHTAEDLASAVKLCRANGMAVMIDLLLGGPGETAQTVRQTIDFIKRINPDCAGATLGVRLYPGTGISETVSRQIAAGDDSGIHRRYDGPVDLFKPTFYISPSLGDDPAGLVTELIGGDKRFFTSAKSDEPEPRDEPAGYNYNENRVLVEAIRNGARGAYWDILRRLNT
ncbi:MAG: radical SAM protein [Sedimentisphaerales bacterium]|nr:radical SAM protein [Sedimentisphaerales bacterium]